ncbi:NUDIX hydrolase [Simkania sp.]|uniref:NUDIX hydrolase n=1 Tax=Simkania sp. TaxID=34094 RepID=UPI003B516744
MELRTEILQMIDRLHPTDAREEADQAFTLQWLRSGVEIFRREKPATPPVHLVSYFVPVDLNLGKILLVHHKKANLWLPPGGHVEWNEHPRETVKREMLEELSVEAGLLQEDPFFLTVTKTVNEMSSHTDVSLWHLVQGESELKYAFDRDEFHEIRWYSYDAIPQKHVEPHLNRFMTKFSHDFREVLR